MFGEMSRHYSVPVVSCEREGGPNVLLLAGVVKLGGLQQCKLFGFLQGHSISV